MPVIAERASRLPSQIEVISQDILVVKTALPGEYRRLSSRLSQPATGIMGHIATDGSTQLFFGTQPFNKGSNSRLEDMMVAFGVAWEGSENPIGGLDIASVVEPPEWNGLTDDAIEEQQVALEALADLCSGAFASSFEVVSLDRISPATDVFVSITHAADGSVRQQLAYAG